jgi:predicted transcriptional regulator
MALFRRSHHGANVRTTGTRLLPDMPFGAQRELLALIDERRPSPVHELAAVPVRDGDHERREATA